MSKRRRDSVLWKRLERLPIVIDSNLVASEITRLSGLKMRSLLFPAKLEACFEQETGPARCKRFWLEGLLALTLFVLLLLLTYFFDRNPDLTILRRLALFIPFALLVNVSMLLHPPMLVREMSVAALAIALGLTIPWLALNHGPVETLTGQFGIALVAIFSNAVMRLRFHFALLVSAALALGTLGSALLETQETITQRASGLCLVWAVLVFTSIANYSHNREERLNFLYCLRGDLLVEGLSRLNDDLALAAEQDGLTGLANRRAFDRRMADAWFQAKEEGWVLAVILIDIDHFKRLNDAFGHLFGDRVLRRVGRLLQESLRKKADFAARFGGEEFVILLPGTPLDNALLVAERMRRLVEVAGLPALEDGDTGQVTEVATVSCGVAAGSPLQYGSLQNFLDSADKALYRAKALGRNGVCTAPEMKHGYADLDLIIASAS